MTTGTTIHIPFWSIGLRQERSLAALLDCPVRTSLTPFGAGPGATWVGWGAKRSARRAASYAAYSGGQTLQLEDGFLRSYGTGRRSPPLSIVIDDKGIYYDSTRVSALEALLASPTDVLEGIATDVARARALILEHRLSKYNHSPLLDGSLLRDGDKRRVLVIDQTEGDLSVALGDASAATFAAMLAAAREENPGATIYVKTHPEVTSGSKKGYLTHVQDDTSTVVLRQPVNPLSLIERMDHVYVVTSTMGFEALLAGKPVSVFGMPWYAGWGATKDRRVCVRRLPAAGRSRSVDELLAAAYFHYTRYLNPVTRRRGTIFDVIDWLIRQRETAALQHGRAIAVGFRRWKAFNVKPLLALDSERVVFVPGARKAAELAPGPSDRLVVWGRDAPPGVAQLARNSGARLVRMEDGFARSVGLGSDLIRPLSLVLDEHGIYFDPTQSSKLEQILVNASFDASELERAAGVRAFIVRHGVTKYNLEPRERAEWPSAGRPVVLVPGQVEDDASIRYGCVDVKTNLGLLEAARRAHPDAFIVYKPHPDVMSGNRAGTVALTQASHLADHVETRLSVVSCIDACDLVHTMTSLTGFDALLRGKHVVVYGQPFYAGWGLTDDVLADGVAFARRRRRLSLDELVAGTLLRYPVYWDWQLKGYTSCEAVLHQIVETRTALESRGALEKLRLGWIRRQRRKIAILTLAWLAET